MKDETNDRENIENRLVFVIDLRTEALEQVMTNTRSAHQSVHRSLPELSEPIEHVALLVDGRDEPLLMPIEPTDDARLLDALGRLLKVAVVAGEPVPVIATEYGDDYERRLLFGKRLPQWMVGGLPRTAAKKLPWRIRRVLARRGPGS